MLSPATCQEVIAILAAQGVEAFYEYPGYVSIPLPDATRFNLSDCEEELSIQHVSEDGELIEDTIDSTISSNLTDAARIANFLGTCYRQATEAIDFDAALKVGQALAQRDAARKIQAGRTTTFEVTIPVTFKVLADCDAEAEHAAMDAVEAIELTDGIIEVGYTCSPRGPWAKRVEVVRG